MGRLESHIDVPTISAARSWDYLFKTGGGSNVLVFSAWLAGHLTLPMSGEGRKRISTSLLKAILIDPDASGANRAAAWLQSRIGGCGLSELGDPFFADGFDQIAKLDDRGELERQIVGVHIVLV